MSTKTAVSKITAASLQNPITRPIAVAGLSVAYPIMLAHVIRKDTKALRSK